jgi:hypothetical protein
MPFRVRYDPKPTSSPEHLPENSRPRTLLKQSWVLFLLQHVKSEGPLHITADGSSAKTVLTSAASRNCLIDILGVEWRDKNLSS